jgi:hypothetical protein
MTLAERICKKLMDQGKWNKSMCYLCRRRVKGEECKLRNSKISVLVRMVKNS